MKKKNLINAPVIHSCRGSLALVLILLTGAHSLIAQNALSSAAFPAKERTPTALADPNLVKRYQQEIKAENLAARLYFFASDFFEGRETAARGQKLAAHYLASQYARIGLAPKGHAATNNSLDPSAYFQRFNVYKRQPQAARLQITSGGKPIAASIFSQAQHDDLSHFSFGSLADASGNLVFAGYGIGDRGLKYDDFAALSQKGIKIDGKWIMILADEPLKDATNSLLTADRKPSKWTTQIVNKRQAIWDNGRPAGVFVVGDAGARAPSSFADDVTRAIQAAEGVGNISLNKQTQGSFPPTFTISSVLADQILAASGHTVKKLTREINQSLKPVVFEALDTKVNASFELFAPLETENVLAFIEGSDAKLKDEVVIISAHYDHLGINSRNKGDQIYNGAADDGSGTVVTLELAASFMQARLDGFGPRRSILFVNFSGEEKGLLGSTYYTDTQPIIPLEKTVANINMDGVGGFDPKHPTGSKDYIYVVGSKELSQELIDNNQRINDITGINLRLDYVPYFASDQFNFAKFFIPFIYYSTGLTEHYHQPTDEPATIDYNHMTRIARLAFANAWQIANQDAPPKGVNRSDLVMKGYVCPPCSLSCDKMKFEHPGECPVCGMNLMPNYELKNRKKN